MPVRITVSKGEKGALQYVKPHDLFFALTCKKKFGPLLDYSDLKPSGPAGQFLSKCGVNEMPSVGALATGVATNYGRTIEGMSGTSSYLGALKELSKMLRDEQGYGSMLSPEAVAALEGAPCLIGLHAEGGSKKWSAVRASECYIGDHPRFVKLFSPLVAPEDASLKELYSFLGSRSISEAVQLEHTPEGTANGTTRVARLVRTRILERACLLLHDIDKPNCPLRPNLLAGAEEAMRQEAFSVSEVCISSLSPCLISHTQARL